MEGEAIVAVVQPEPVMPAPVPIAPAAPAPMVPAPEPAALPAAIEAVVQATVEPTVAAVAVEEGESSGDGPRVQLMEYPPTDPMSAEEALATAEREGLVLVRADNKAGFQGVAYVAGKSKAFQAIVRRRGESVRLGRFFTPEEAALCRARTPEGQLAIKKNATNEQKGAFLSSEEAEELAAAEGLTLVKGDSQTGYVGVSMNLSSNVRPFAATIRRGGKSVNLGQFATPEAAALMVARATAEQSAWIPNKDGPPKNKAPLKRKEPAMIVPSAVATAALPMDKDPEYLPAGVKKLKPPEPIASTEVVATVIEEAPGVVAAEVGYVAPPM